MSQNFGIRQSEIEQIKKYFTAGSKGVLITGPEGIGKTWLTDSFVHNLLARGFPVRRLYATENCTGPWSSFASLFAEAEVDPASASSVAALRLLTQTATGAGRTIVVFDAINLADKESLGAIELGLKSGDFFLIATARDRKLSRLKGMLKQQDFHRIELEPLTASQITELVEKERQVESAIDLQKIRSKAGGIPLDLQRVLEWSIDDWVEWIDSEMERAQLNEHDRKTLKMLALAEPIEPKILAEATGSESLKTLELNSWIYLVDGNRIYFKRRAVKTAFEALLEKNQLTQIQLAEELESLLSACDHPDLYSLQRVQLMKITGNKPEAELLAAGADQALHQGNSQLALALAEEALEAKPTSPMARIAAEAAFFSRQPDTPEKHYELATSLASSPAESLEVVLSQARMLFYAGQPDKAFSLLTRASEDFKDQKFQTNILNVKAELLGFTSEWGQTAEMLARQAESSDDADLLSIYAFARNWVGRHPEAKEAINRARASNSWNFARARFKQWVGFSETYLQIFTSNNFDLESKLADYRINNADFEGPWLGMSIVRGFVTGELTDRDLQNGADVLAIEQETGQSELYPLELLIYALANAMVSRRSKAKDILQAYKEVEAIDLTNTGLKERTLYWLLYTDETFDRNSRVEKAAATARDTGHSLIGSMTLFAALHFYDSVRFGFPTEAVEPLAEISKTMESPLIAIMAEHAKASAEKDIHCLDKIAGQYLSKNYRQFAAEVRQEIHKVSRSVPTDSLELRQDQLKIATMGPSVLDNLTPTQRKVVKLAAQDFTNQQIADSMTSEGHFITSKTVSAHLNEALSRIGESIDETKLSRSDLKTYLD